MLRRQTYVEPCMLERLALLGATLAPPLTRSKDAHAARRARV